MKGAWVQRCRGAVVLAAWVLSATIAISAQHEGHQPAPPRSAAKPEPTPQPVKVLGWEPIRCWRQSSAGAVTIGETFTVVLTCAVYEADNAQVIPDESRLGVASIQLAPFEILGGSHPPDVRRGSRRFFQYDYQLRIISRDAIGHDVNIPPLPIAYRIHSRVGAAATLEGRDLSYVMPMMPIKVLSLVPADADDIRDASEASLGAVESLRFRSSLFRVLTFTFVALAAVMAVLAFVPLARSRAATADDVARARSNHSAGFSTTRVQQLEGLQAGLSTLTAALYRQEPTRDASALDDAVRHAVAVAKDVSAERSWWSSKWRS